LPTTDHAAWVIVAITGTVAVVTEGNLPDVG
jgi:hypothetical protein